MTDETPSATPADATGAQLSRPPARFFFEIGYYACWAEAVARSAGTPPFALSDQLLDRAWSIAGEAHDDRAEFDRYLVSANSADDRLAAAEATYRAFAEGDLKSAGSTEELRSCASSLREFGADLFPVNRDGQAHFARILMDVTANAIEAALNRRPRYGRPVTTECGIAMVAVTVEDRNELERGLITQGFPPDRAKEIAHEQAANDGALQMLARHRIASALPSPGGVDEVAARMAAADGLDWHEQCAHEASEGANCCDSGTCVAAHYEDHDPAVARRQYRRYARVALGIQADPAREQEGVGEVPA